MNINIKTAAVSPNYQTSNTAISGTSVSNTDKINTEIAENINNDYIKSDTYLNSSQELQYKNYTGLFSFVKKFLYNEQFREIAINSNPVLKEVYESFLSAIEMDDSKLGEYIKSVLADSGKFSGEFFDALNKLMLETNDTSLKNSIYSFLKVFDYYFSQSENASGVNSAFNDILSKLPEDVKNALLTMFANNAVNKINFFFLSAFAMNLPDKEKIKVILSYMLDLINSSNYTPGGSNSDNILNIFIPENQLSEEIISLASKLIASLKEADIKLPEDIKSLLDALDNAVKDFKASHNQSVHDKILSSIIVKEQASVAEAFVKLAQGIGKNENTLPEKSLDNIVKFLVNLNNTASFKDKNEINSIIDKFLSVKQFLNECLPIKTLYTKNELNSESNTLISENFQSDKNILNAENIKNTSILENSQSDKNILNAENIKDTSVLENSQSDKNILNSENIKNTLVFESSRGDTQAKGLLNIIEIFDNIKNSILKSDAYPDDIKEQVIILSDKLVSSLLDRLVLSDVSKNKCELLLNIYEKDIVPILLKSNNASSKNSLSALTHNLLRLKLGTASEFNKHISALFNQLEYTKSIDRADLLYMKLGLMEKIISQNREPDIASSAFLKLLDNGIRLSSNDLNKAAFENTLLSLISKNDISGIYKHFFIPLLYNGANVLSEIFLSKEKVKNEERKDNVEEVLDNILKITLFLDIEEIGIFNTTLFYSDGQVSARVSAPEKYKENYENIEKDINEIIQKNKLFPKKILVTEDIDI